MKIGRDGKEEMYLLYPKVCILCKKVLPFCDRKKGVCPSCKEKLRFVGENRCRICGKELTVPLETRCKDCKAHAHQFDAGRSLLLYQGEIKTAMYKFKYSNARYMADFFGKAAAKRYGDWIRHYRVEAIIPVPMYPGKKRSRGYNQAEVFAKALGKHLKIPVRSDLVERKKNTVPQKCLTREQRKENLKNAFKIKGHGVKLNCVLIVDDIYTTGSTMDAVAKALKRYGVERVLCLTICIGADT